MHERIYLNTNYYRILNIFTVIKNLSNSVFDGRRKLIEIYPDRPIPNGFGIHQEDQDILIY
jgi:hypothetical protein